MEALDNKILFLLYANFFLFNILFLGGLLVYWQYCHKLFASRFPSAAFSFDRIKFGNKFTNLLSIENNLYFIADWFY